MIALICALLWAAIALPQTVTAPASEGADLARVRSALTAGNLDWAERQLKTLLENDPGNGEVISILARVYTARDDPDLAARTLAEFLRDHPGDYFRRLQLARLRYQMADLKEYGRQLDHLEKIAGDRGEHLELLGDLYLTRGDDKKSFAAYQRAAGAAGSGRLKILQEKTALIASNPSLKFDQGFAFPAVDENPGPESYPPFPSMTDSAVRNSISGIVQLLVRFDEKGEAGDVILLSRAGYGLDWRAVLWASSLRKKPAQEGGVPVPVWVVVELSFEEMGRGLNLRHELPR